MERLGPDVHFAGAITSVFRLSHAKYIPDGSKSGTLTYSRSCGMGWRFGMLCKIKNGQVMLGLYFDPYLMDPSHKAIHFTISVLPSIDEELLGDKVIPVLDASLPESKGKQAVNGNLHQIKSFTPLSSSPTLISAWHLADLIRNPVLRITVSSREGNSQNAAPSSVPLDIQNILNMELMNGTSSDVKFWLFSRRKRIQSSEGDLSEARVFHPKALYANSHLLRSRLDYFKTLLSDNGFREAVRTDLSSPYPEEDEESAGNKYDYESDSDLDDEDGVDSRTSAPSEHESTLSKMRIGAATPVGSTGQVVVMKTTAFRTWHAFIFYLLTGRINFLPLKSSYGKQASYSSAVSQRLEDYPEEPAPCSPKSMYRLADELGHEALQKISLEAIRERLTTRNIVEEAFSRYTSRYAAIRDIQTDFLRRHLTQAEVSATLDTKMRAAMNGELPHGFDTLTTLINELSRSRDKSALDPTDTNTTSCTKSNTEPGPMNPSVGDAGGGFAPNLFEESDDDMGFGLFD